MIVAVCPIMYVGTGHLTRRLPWWGTQSKRF